MKTRRNVYIVIGAIFIVLNLFIDFVRLFDYQPDLAVTSFSVGYLIGSHIFLIIGLILLGMAYKLQKRIRREFEIGKIKKEIDSVGSDQ